MCNSWENKLLLLLLSKILHEALCGSPCSHDTYLSPIRNGIPINLSIPPHSTIQHIVLESIYIADRISS